MTSELNEPDASTGTSLTRRKLLAGAAGVAGVVALGGTGSALGSVLATPRRGGTLRFGVPSGGEFETLNPGFAYSLADFPRIGNILDTLTNINVRTSRVVPGLAVAWDSNPNATVWTIKLRKGVRWHDGSAFTADDVVFALNAMLDPTHQASSTLFQLTKAGIRKVDRLTVRLTLSSPNARLMELFTGTQAAIIKAGTTNFKAPVGTGAFIFESFTPGQQSTFRRNPNYWGGPPLVNRLQIISFPDANARVQALLSGQIDVTALPTSQRRSVQGKPFGTIQAAGGLQQMFTMRVDQKPFDDFRVRRAMRLLVDRPALVRVATGGLGRVNNDLPGFGMPYYADEFPQRKYDPEKAKALLKQAGAEGLTVQLDTAPANDGMVEAATLFSQQAKAGGVNIQLNRVTADSYFNPKVYLNRTFGQTFWGALPLSWWYTQTMLSDAFLNETHWKNKQFDKVLLEAIGAKDPKKAEQRWRAVQSVMYGRGGYIIWGQQRPLTAFSNKLQGLNEDQDWASIFRFNSAWFGA